MLSVSFFCLVIGITDGDTLTARCGQPGSYEQVKIRLAEIDAPEKRQPFGEHSRQHLAALCFEKQAEIRPIAKDRYGRTVARVTCAGQDANAAQVRDGMAWAYTKYLTDPGMAKLEQGARAAHRGLWADKEPVAPWEWRGHKRVYRDLGLGGAGPVGETLITGRAAPAKMSYNEG